MADAHITRDELSVEQQAMLTDGRLGTVLAVMCNVRDELHEVAIEVMDPDDLKAEHYVAELQRAIDLLGAAVWPDWPDSDEKTGNEQSDG